MYKPLNRKLTMVQKLELTRRLMKGYIQHREDPRIQILEKKVLEYNESLNYYGLSDHQVEKTAISKNSAIHLVSVRLVLLITYTLFAVPFALLNLPIAVIASILSQRKAQEALSKSSVKIWGRDVLSTWKILFGLALLAVFYTLYTIIFFILQLKWGYGFLLACKHSFYFTILLPFGTYAALRLGETGIDIYKSLKPLWYVIFPSVFYYQPTERLRELRQDLSRQVNLVINEMGPSLFPDFQMYFLKDTDLKDEVAQTMGLQLGLGFLTNWNSQENLAIKNLALDNAWELVDKKDFDKATAIEDDPTPSIIQKIPLQSIDDDALEINLTVRQRVNK